MSAPLSVAVVGCGHMGTLHARTIADDPDSKLVACVDIRIERAKALADRYGGQAMTGMGLPVDVAIVAVPTSQHIRVARPLLEAGVWCLIEKPIDDGEALWSHPRARVGHVERYNRGLHGLATEGITALQATRYCVPPERPVEDDVFLDLLVHDLDLALQWVKLDELLEARAASVEDGLAQEGMARWSIVGGGEARFEVSRVADKPCRRIAWVGAGQEVDVDLIQGRARVGAQEAHPGDTDPLRAQWAGFKNAIRGGVSPAQPATCEEAYAAVELALEARREALRATP